MDKFELKLSFEDLYYLTICVKYLATVFSSIKAAGTIDRLPFVKSANFDLLGGRSIGAG